MKRKSKVCVPGWLVPDAARLIFGVRFREAYESLFDRVGSDLLLRPDVKMMPFHEILHHGLWLFYLVALWSLAGAVLHRISYYTGGSKSIYLMRRLPQRWELLRRDITLPITGAVISLLAALLMRLLFLAIYYLVTPAQCLV